MFERKSQVLIEMSKISEDDLMAIVLDAGADDIRNDGLNWEVLSAPMPPRRDGSDTEGEDRDSFRGNRHASHDDGETRRQETPDDVEVERMLEDHDDVQSVYSNFDIDEKEMEALA
jgi:transcriptional/translational regulatory protein YebC/TACO1